MKVTITRGNTTREMGTGDSARKPRAQRCGAPTTKNAASAQRYATCRGVLKNDQCPDASSHVEL